MSKRDIGNDLEVVTLIFAILVFLILVLGIYQVESAGQNGSPLCFCQNTDKPVFTYKLKGGV